MEGYKYDKRVKSSHFGLQVSVKSEELETLRTAVLQEKNVSCSSNTIQSFASIALFVPVTK